MPIRLSDYTADWIQMYEEEITILRQIYGDEIIQYEHFGSTSVPGLKAKPIIDIICIVHDTARIDSFNDTMTALGYKVAGEYGIPGRRLFSKGGENRTHHIHMYPFAHPEIKRHLVFRDYLRAHPAEAQRYARLKEQLAQQFDNTGDYSVAKTPFIKEMERKALLWYEARSQDPSL